MKKYDYSLKMSQDLINLDALTFKDITLDADSLAKRMKQNSAYELFIKYIADEPAGFIGIMYVSTPHYNAAWIDLMAVNPKFQNKGIAKEMITFIKASLSAEKNSLKNNVEFISALIRKSNIASLSAAKSQGFKSDGNGDFELLFLDMEKI